jgi:hypothetical protein
MSSLEIEIRQRGDKSMVTLVGVIDEGADFSALASLRNRAEINMKGVRRVNSYGARSWMDAIRNAAKRCELEFVECSSCVIDQLNMLQGFLGHGQVRSFYGPMICEVCDNSVDHLFTARDILNGHGGLPEVECEHCARPMVMDDLEDQYLLFLREPTLL